MTTSSTGMIQTTEHRVCPVCNGKIRAHSLAVRNRGGEIVHPGCRRRYSRSA